MKRRISTLIRIQALQRDLVAREHHEAQSAAAAADRALRAKQAQVNAARSAFGDAQSHGANQETLGLYTSYLSQAHHVLERAEDTLSRLQVEAEDSRNVLTDAVQILQTYQRYHERLLDLDMTETRQREAKELDEIAIQGHTHDTD